MSHVTFTVNSFDVKPGPMTFVNMMDRVIAGRAEIDFESNVEIIDPSKSEAKDWELGYHQTVISSKQSDFYSDDHGREIYEHMVDTALTPANDRVEMTSWSWVGWMTEPTKFSDATKVITVKAWDRPSCGGAYTTTNKKASLTRTVLAGQFCTWLVARKSDPVRTRGELQWLNWVRWDIILAAPVDPKKFKLTPGKDTGTHILKQGKQGDTPPVVPAIDHIWKDKESWYSLAGGKRTLLSSEP